MIVQGEQIGRWVCEKAGGQWTETCQAIGQIDAEGNIFVGVIYDGYTGASIAIHSRCDEPKRVSRTFYKAIFDYPFNKLKVKRLTGLVCINNKKAQRVNEHLGFKRETILADYFPEGDAIVYIMRPEECRFLNWS